MIGLFGIATQVGPMSALPKPPCGIVHIEAFCNSKSASAVIQVQGTISGKHWDKVGEPIALTGIIPKWFSVAGVNYSRYRIDVVGIKGDGANVTAYLGD